MATGQSEVAEGNEVPADHRVERVARGYLAITRGDAWAALLMLAADRAVEQEALAVAHGAVSVGFLRADRHGVYGLAGLIRRYGEHASTLDVYAQLTATCRAEGRCQAVMDVPAGVRGPSDPRSRARRGRMNVVRRALRIASHRVPGGLPMNEDPREAGPRPPFPGDQQQRRPGLTSKMTPAPDHGEKSYVGKGLLTGKVALITGGDSGIGRAVAIAYAREGAHVAISYLDVEQSDAEETKAWVEKAGRRCLLLPGDLRDEAHCRDLVARTVAEFGALDILVNNAAAQVVNEGLDDVTAEDIEGSFRANVFAMYYLTQAAVPHMKPGAAIVNSTSQQAKVATKSMLIYAATKGAIASLTIGLSNLLAPQGIRVNCVAPGPVWTPIQPIVKGPDEIAQLGADTPLGRAGQPAELAPAYVLLASREGSYMTGALVPVTGGTPML